MISYAKTKYDKLKSRMQAMIDASPESCVPLDDWWRRAKMLAATKDFFDNESWDEIQTYAGLDWVKGAREDQAFREFYLLYRELIKMEVFL